MARLPVLYAGKPIIDRIPYHMDGQLAISAGQPLVSFDLTQFEHTNDKPFEVHRMICKYYALGAPTTTPVARTNLKLVLPGRPIQPQPQFLEHAVRVDVAQESRSGQKITKNMVTGRDGTLLSIVSKPNKRVWEWNEPFTMARGDVLSVAASADTFTFAPFDTNLSAFTAVVAMVLVSVDFQGQLVVVDRPVKRSRFAPAEALGRARLRKK